MSDILPFLLTQYCELTPSDNLYKLGENFNYYYADDFNSRILTRNLIKVDIKSAFPTICEIMFGSNSKFIRDLKLIEDKLERNIFISNSLKDVPDKNYLLELNNYSKIIVFNYIFNNYEDVTVFEYQKDGVLFSGTKIGTKNTQLKEILNKYFIFHIDQISIYIRFARTSLYYLNDTLEVKGAFKNPPLFITDTIKKLFKEPYSNIYSILDIYDYQVFNVFKALNLIDKLNYYYKFNNNYYLDRYGAKKTSPSDCDPRAILKYFLYPIISMLRTE